MTARRRACGSCTLCCNLMGVVMDAPEPIKPANTDCAHCSGRGCAIYDDRPKACRDFKCGWLASQRLTGGGWPIAARPDKSGVVVEVNSQGNMCVHQREPDDWQREPLRSFLIRKAARVGVMIDIEGKAHQLMTDGSLRALVWVGNHPETNERMYLLEKR